MEKQNLKYWKAIVNVVMFILASLLIIFLLPKLIVFFLPFVIGWIISAIANPPVKFLEEKIRFKRKAVSAIVIILVIAIIILVGYGIGLILVNQTVGFVTSLPEKWAQWEIVFKEIGKKADVLLTNLPLGVRNSITLFSENIEKYISGFISSLGTPTWEFLSGIAMNLPSTIIGVIMCVLSAYIFTAERNTLSLGLKKIMPELYYKQIRTVANGMKRAVGGYLKAQVKIEIWVYLVLILGFTILDVEYGLLIALGIAVLDFLPFFGAGAVMVPWAIVCLMSGDYTMAIGLLIDWGVGQLVRQLIQPKIVGDSIGMSPLPTLILLFVGFHLAGVIGMIVAVPIGMIVVSLYEEGLFDTFLNSLRILWGGISRFRRLDQDDLEKK